jgi:hypothetical protein
MFGYGQQNATGSKTIGGASPLVKGSTFSSHKGNEVGVATGVLSNKQLRGQQLRGQLQMLHMQIASLPSGDPTRWHKLLDEYVVRSAELYKTLSE